MGDRARRGLVQARRDPRPAARGSERADLRRLAADPLRPEDAAGDRRRADDARLADVLADDGVASGPWTMPGASAPGGSCRLSLLPLSRGHVVTSQPK